jgi:hypothetical protein
VDLLRGEVTSPAYDAVHRRAVLFVAGEYWLVLDALRGERPHDYALRWHLAYDDPPTVEASPAGIIRVTTRAVRLDLGGPSGRPLPVAVEPGWVAPEYGVRTPAPVVVATPHRADDVDLVTLLAPGRAGASPSLRSADLASGSLVVELPGGATDRILWHPHLRDPFDAELAPRRRDEAP